MTPQAALAEWLNRLGAMGGTPLLTSSDELSRWPETFVAVLKTKGMLVKTMPAPSVDCPGCERACNRPVETPTDSLGVVWPFVMCDLRSDTGRVPVSVAMVERWKSSIESLAQALAKLLDAPLASVVDISGSVWSLGSVRGKALRGRVELNLDDALELRVSGRRVQLADVLSFDGANLTLEVSTLEGMADMPIDHDVTETAEVRKERLTARIATLKAAGVRGFRKIVQEEEGISATRLRQIIGPVSKDTAKSPDVFKVWNKSKVRKPKPDKSKR